MLLMPTLGLGGWNGGFIEVLLTEAIAPGDPLTSSSFVVPNRPGSRLVVAVAWCHTTTTNRQCTSVTVGGVGLAQDHRAISAATPSNAEFYSSLSVPAGSTTAVLDFDGASCAAVIAVLQIGPSAYGTADGQDGNPSTGVAAFAISPRPGCIVAAHIVTQSSDASVFDDDVSQIIKTNTATTTVRTGMIGVGRATSPGSVEVTTTAGTNAVRRIAVMTYPWTA